MTIAWTDSLGFPIVSVGELIYDDGVVYVLLNGNDPVLILASRVKRIEE